MKHTNIFRLVLCLAMLLGGVGVSWGQTALTQGGSLSGNYILSEANKNVTITTSITVESGKELTIDLNGYVLAGKGIDYVIKVEGGGKLTIKDSRPTKDMGHLGNLNDKGILIWPYTSGNQSFYGGTIYNTYVDENTDRKGIWVEGECVIECANIMGCYSKSIGAAVTVTSCGKFTMNSGQISYNYSKGDSEHGRAGAIYGEPANNNAGSSISLSNTTVSYNHSEQSGGAICGFNVTLSDCTIEHNTTTQRGGGIYMRGNGSSLTIKGTTAIRNNTAGMYGGGICTNGNLTIKGNSANELVTIEKNEALYYLEKEGTDGGAVGGGIYAYHNNDNTDTDVTCNIEYALIKNNYATSTGGGIYGDRVDATIKNSTIEENWAMYSEAGNSETNLGRGGGFNFTGEGVEVILENTKVIKNESMYYGGGGQITGKAKLTMQGTSQINDNKVILHGAGGLHVTSSSTFIFEEGQISNNTAATVGGGIHSSYGCTLELTGGTISGNTAMQRGGGVHINTGGELTLDGTNVINNVVKTAPDYYACEVIKNSDGTYTYKLDKSIKKDVDYVGYGGGVLIDAGTCTMNGGELSDNSAEVGGGGLALVMIRLTRDTGTNLRLYKVANFTLNNGTIKGNKTTGQPSENEEIGDGAGVYIMDNKIKDVLISGNINSAKDWITNEESYNKLTQDVIDELNAVIPQLKAGISKATINGGTLSGNVATGNGGALLVNGNVEMTAGEFKQNTAKDGGGICVLGGAVSITKGTISNNTATNYGGGIYVANTDPNATITISGEGTFENNKALAGGGMAVNGPFTFNFQGTLQNNTAKNGGGIYLMPGTSNNGNTKGATLNFNGGFIRNNVAEGTPKLSDKTAYQKGVTDVEGVGGGVFLADYTTLNFYIADKQLGFYGNQATNAADDIFANGKGTSVTLPKVSDMTLTDYPVPAGELYWIEDYYSHYENEQYESDSQYSQGTNKLAGLSDLVPNHNVRYRHALENAMVTRIENSKVEENSYTQYACFTLGYQIFYVTIKKTGLKDGESALFDLSYIKNNVTTPYLTMLLKGDKAKTTVERRVALPEGKWKVDEQTRWSWTYTPSGETSVTKEVKAADVTFEFTNTKQSTAILHDEDIEVNKMGQK